MKDGVGVVKYILRPEGLPQIPRAIADEPQPELRRKFRGASIRFRHHVGIRAKEPFSIEVDQMFRIFGKPAVNQMEIGRLDAS